MFYVEDVSYLDFKTAYHYFRSHRVGGRTAGEGFWVRRHLLRPVPAGRHREVVWAGARLHATGNFINK